MGEITLFQGDITALEVDAIVNAANDHLWMGGGVAGAIKRKGGVEIEQEAVRQGPVEIGESVVTGAGSLPAHYVIHAAVMGQDLQTDAVKVRRATRSALRRAREFGIASVALPALGTGVGGFPLTEAARIMIEEARRHLADKTSVRRITFSLFDREAYDAFERELEQ
ncbi:MAG TPA: macro domain-containing protein [Armatimonadota bacterium]|nr:macro domain-containing protein [Armatimonadota bacterium]